MTDLRPRALEKARERAKELKAQQDALNSVTPIEPAKQPSAGFLTDRQRAKEQLRNQIGGYNGQNVRKIAAESEIAGDDRILRVAAYCRVSTDDINQTVSIELQKSNYRDMIRANPKWHYVGTFVDDGFSGTNTEHRPAFQLMMKKVLSGEIDMIITKSVSRFARNLVDCISWVRRLKDLPNPVQIYFEQEGLRTLESTSNIILFVLAMVAEEESHMKSEAMLLSLEWRFSRGRFIVPRLLGYDLVKTIDITGAEKKELVINADQARTIRLMYYMLLQGSSPAEIAETLTDLGRETGGLGKDGKPNTRWTASGVVSTMRNERYCGDVLARKTWTPDFHDHKAKKNNGKKNKYFQPGHHEAIVTRAQWNAAQRILNSRRFNHSGKYIPMKVIERGALKGYIPVNRNWAGFDADEYYRTSSIVLGLSEGDLEADLGSEHLPDGGHKLGGITDDNGVQRIARELSKREQIIQAQLDGTFKEDKAASLPKIKPGFQVASKDMFNHFNDPSVGIDKRSITFNTACITRMEKQWLENGGIVRGRCHYVEMLLNPVDRMIAVRPCSPDNVNALPWCTSTGHGCKLSTSAFCRVLFTLMGWDDNYGYRAHAMVRRNGGETILFFDLDTCIVRQHAKRPSTAEAAQATTYAEDDGKGIFYGADDEPETLITTEETLRMVREQEEIAKKLFGTPFMEHDDNCLIPAIDINGEWDVMAEARSLDDDHSVGMAAVDALQDELMDAMFAPAED